MHTMIARTGQKWRGCKRKLLYFEQCLYANSLDSATQMNNFNGAGGGE